MRFYINEIDCFFIALKFLTLLIKQLGEELVIALCCFALGNFAQQDKQEKTRD